MAYQLPDGDLFDPRANIPIGRKIRRDELGRETVVRDWDYATGEFKKYQLRYYHDAQPRQEGNTSKPNATTLISQVEGNSLQYFDTVFDSAAPDPDTNALVFGEYNGSFNALQGDGVITPNDPLDAGPGGTTTVIPVAKPTRFASALRDR